MSNSQIHLSKTFTSLHYFFNKKERCIPLKLYNIHKIEIKFGLDFQEIWQLADTFKKQLANQTG